MYVGGLCLVRPRSHWIVPIAFLAWFKQVDTHNIYYVVHSSCSTMLKSLGIIFHPSESVFFMQLTAQDQEQIKICQP